MGKSDGGKAEGHPGVDRPEVGGQRSAHLTHDTAQLDRCESQTRSSVRLERAVGVGVERAGPSSVDPDRVPGSTKRTRRRRRRRREEGNRSGRHCSVLARSLRKRKVGPLHSRTVIAREIRRTPIRPPEYGISKSRRLGIGACNCCRRRRVEVPGSDPEKGGQGTSTRSTVTPGVSRLEKDDPATPFPAANEGNAAPSRRTPSTERKSFFTMHHCASTPNKN